MINVQHIKDAALRIGGHIVHTPCVRSHFLSERYKANIFLKLESFQSTGSFKERGALNCLLALTPEQRKAGVVTASAGNHAQAVAYHSGRLGIRSIVFMPTTTPPLKISRTANFGAEVRLVGEDYDDAYEEASRFAEAKGSYYLHAYNNDYVIAGQGTIGLELAKQIPNLDLCVIAVGGGGLAAGIAVALKSAAGSTKIIGVEPTNNASMAHAIKIGRPEYVPPAKTIADGIAVRKAGNLTYEICSALLDELLTVSDDQIANAMADLWEMQKIIAEGAGAAALAAIPSLKDIEGKNICAIIGGGNVDNGLLFRIIERRLAQLGRLVSLEITLATDAGAMSTLLATLAENSVNLLSLTRKYQPLETNFFQQVVEINAMARCGQDATKLLSKLRALGFQVNGGILGDFP